MKASSLPTEHINYAKINNYQLNNLALYQVYNSTRLETEAGKPNKQTKIEILKWLTPKYCTVNVRVNFIGFDNP